MPSASVGASAARVEAVVTHHRDGFRSGVARFNELLAASLGVPLYGVDDDVEPGCSLEIGDVAVVKRVEPAVDHGHRAAQSAQVGGRDDHC